MSDIEKTINDCKKCSFFNQCIPSAFDAKDLYRFSNIVKTNEKQVCNTNLFQQGSSAQHLYIVKSGGFKTHSSLATGSLRIHEFFLPGELIGLDSMAGGIALTTATAIEDSLVCRINYLQLAALRREFPLLSDLAVKMYGQALAASQVILECLSKPSAASRVACFILIILRRSGPLNGKPNDLYLNMPIKDIANHLGLAGETVSRAFAKLVSWGYITKNRRHIHILDSEGLQLCASNTEF